MRVRYWSHSKLANWLRSVSGAPKMPAAETFKGWEEYKARAKAHSKFIYWLADDALDGLQDIVMWPKDKLDSFSYWVYNRFIDKAWCIDTGLDRNSWHETDTKLLHGMFEELVKFVEVQKAWMNTDEHKVWQDELPYFIRKLLPYRNWQAGVGHLLWEISLKQDHHWYGYDSDDEVPEEYKSKETWGKPTYQAQSALEILDLYCWWKYIRPNRPDPMDASGYTEYFNTLRSEGRALLDLEDRSDAEREWRESCSKKCNELEEQYEKEDTDMMIRLIKVRRSLWT